MVRLIVAPDTQTGTLIKLGVGLPSRPGAQVALRYATKFRAAFQHLITFPETGARRSTLARDMRIWPVTPYLIFYRFVADGAGSANFAR